MKAKPYQVKALTSQIKQGFKGALIYGPDFGIVQELSEKIAENIVPDLRDNLSVIKLTPSKIKEIPSILLDEANAVGLLGGRKLIWLKEADNTCAEAVENYLQYCQTDAFLLMSAGNLTKTSTLRTFADSQPDILSIACYADEAKDVATFIQEVLAAQKIQVGGEALELLVERLSENRMRTRKELDKLISYLNDKKKVDPADVKAIITDVQNSSVDTFCCAVATGQQQVAEKEYHLMLENGENPVSIIRILYLYFNKLLDAAEEFSKAGMAGALKKIMKPAQFRLESVFQKQIQIWKKSNILKVLNLLIEAETQAKTTGLPAELLLDRVVMQITGAAKRQK